MDKKPEMVSVDSTNIEEVSYDPKSLKFHVRFLETGKTYVFYGVEEARYHEFMKAESKGQYLNTDIKTKYRYEEVDLNNPPKQYIDV